MSFTSAIKSFYSRYADFSGRSTRAEYWYGLLWFLLGAFLCAVVDDVFFGLDLEERWLGLAVVFAMLNIVPVWALSFRRLQDMGWPGWISAAVWVISFLPAVIPPNVFTGQSKGLLELLVGLCGVLYLIWMCRPGEPKSNSYGPPVLISASTGSAETRIDQLGKLEQLLEKRLITADEFSALKKKLTGSN